MAFPGIRLAICHADDTNIPTEANLAVDLTGLSCPDALQALDNYPQVMEGSAFSLRLNGQELSTGTFPGAALTRDDHERLARLRLTVEDLHLVQQHARHYFSVPGELPLGSVHVYHPRVLAEDAEQLLRALAAGRAAGQEVTLRPADGEPYRLCLARPGDTTDLSTLAPTPLAIPDPNSGIA